MNYRRRYDDVPDVRRRRAIVIRENDRIAAAIVKIRDNYTCQMCGKKVEGRNADWSHIIPRTHWAVRWNTRNAFCACFRCHKFVWHDDPIKATQWAEKFFGIKTLAQLHAQDVLVHVTDEWVDNWNAALKAEYLRLTGFTWKSR